MGEVSNAVVMASGRLTLPRGPLVRMLARAGYARPYQGRAPPERVIGNAPSRNASTPRRRVSPRAMSLFALLYIQNSKLQESEGDANFLDKVDITVLIEPSKHDAYYGNLFEEGGNRVSHG
jgi:hypothetical protein